MDSRKSLRPNFRYGGLKKVFEDEGAAQRSYAMTAKIRVGESSGRKASFWLETFDTAENTGSDEF